LAPKADCSAGDDVFVFCDVSAEWLDFEVAGQGLAGCWVCFIGGQNGRCERR